MMHDNRVYVPVVIGSDATALNVCVAILTPGSSNGSAAASASDSDMSTFTLQQIVDELELGRSSGGGGKRQPEAILVRDGAVFQNSFNGNKEAGMMQRAPPCEWRVPEQLDAPIVWVPELQLHLTNAPLRLVIVEGGADPQTVEVPDSATPQDIRDALSHHIHETLNVADRLSILHGGNEEDEEDDDDDELEEDVSCREQNVRDGATLRLQRSSLKRIHQYVCECGAMVELQRVDIIMCRACGCHVVYKPRTTRPVRYVAR